MTAQPWSCTHEQLTIVLGGFPAKAGEITWCPTCGAVRAYGSDWTTPSIVGHHDRELARADALAHVSQAAEALADIVLSTAGAEAVTPKEWRELVALARGITHRIANDPALRRDVKPENAG